MHEPQQWPVVVAYNPALDFNFLEASVCLQLLMNSLSGVTEFLLAILVALCISYST